MMSSAGGVTTGGTLVIPGVGLVRADVGIKDGRTRSSPMRN